MHYMQITRLLGEITPLLINARVQKVYQNEEHLLQLELYSGHETVWLTVRTGQGASGIYLAEGRLGPSRHDHPEFCNKLRHDLTGAFLSEIQQVKNERVVKILFAPAPLEKPERSLVLELFSNASNCFLLDVDGIILTLMHPALSRKRGNFPNQPYTAPPEAQTSSAIGDANPLESMLVPGGKTDYNSVVKVWIEDLAEKQNLERERREGLKSLAREEKHLTRLADAHVRTLEEAKLAGWYRECGEILAAHFNSLRRGMEKIRLPDLYTNPLKKMREIPLDPKLPPQENLQRYFKRARKLDSGAEYARAQLETIGHRREALERAAEQVGRLESIGEIREILAPLALERRIQSREKTPQKTGERLPYREFTAEDGSAILVGRKDRDNDNLTFRVARGRDLWLHISGAPGSHVVLRADREGNFSDQALLDAAHLAVFYSNLKSQNSADVDYTSCKYVSKPKGLPPGKVTLSERKTIHVRLEPTRLDRLLGRDSLRRPD